MRPDRTFSIRQIESHRAEHARADGYGRHRHLYLHDTMRRLCDGLGFRIGGLSLLDYGCGKGGFLQEMQTLGLFAETAGYDPAVAEFRTHPDHTYNIVVCLDVLDMVEPRFLHPVLDDIAQLATDIVLFDVLTMPTGGRLRPHPPFYWAMLIRERLKVVETRVEFASMAGFERAIILASPAQSASNSLSSPSQGS